jgi:hypothetical protein
MTLAPEHIDCAVQRLVTIELSRPATRHSGRFFPQQPEAGRQVF